MTATAVKLTENPYEEGEGPRVHIQLPEPDGLKCAELHFDFPSTGLAVDMDPEQARSELRYALDQGNDLVFKDPFFGEDLYFPRDQLSHIMYVGCTWVPHEQLRAQALKNKIERGGRRK